MERKIICLLVSIVVVASLSAVTDDIFSGIEIFHTDLHVTISSDTASLNGEVHYSAVARQDLNPEQTIGMHFYRLRIDSVSVNGEKAIAVFPLVIPAPEFFEIMLPESMTIAPGDTLTVSVWYSRLYYPSVPNNDSDRDGYYYFKQGESRWGQTAPHTIGYTMSQPRDARAWFPTVDKPWNKSTLRMSVTVDSPVNVIANGELTDIVGHDNGTVTYVYEHPYPIAPYLFAFNAGPFHEHATTYTSKDGRTIPIASYLFQADASWVDSANSMMKNMFEVFENLFGPYPFDRYGMIAIQPFRYGGMEHQTITTMRRNLFLSERITAHELAHQWWGNLVTCRTWENIWLNEGFASYAEALYTEAKEGSDARNGILELFAGRYFSEDDDIRYPIYAPPEGYIFGIAIYLKGAWVLHMLRNLLGDEIFFRTLRRYAEVYGYTTAGTEQLQSVFESETGMELEWFFNQWVYEAGYPVYRIKTDVHDSVDPDMYDMEISLEQIQSDAPEVFQGPIEILIMHEKGDTLVTFWNDQRRQDFLVSVHGRPDTVVFDPDGKILKKIDYISSVEGDRMPDRLTLSQNYPNPFNTSTVIEYMVPEASHVRIRVIDTLGREVAVLVDRIHDPGRHELRFDAAGHASGVYFAVMESDGSSKVRKMTYIR
jgi:aminopeptidase N